MPSAAALVFSGGGATLSWRPKGASGLVTTKSGLIPSSTNFSKTITEKSEVPKNTYRKLFMFFWGNVLYVKCFIMKEYSV